MSISRRQVTISGIQVEVVREDIKNLHLGVYPPTVGCGWPYRSRSATAPFGWP
jgi:hypothetical protein